MLFLIVISAFALLGVRAQSPPATYTKCSDLPQVPINYTLASMYSPLLVMRSSEPGYNCATGFLTGPAPIQSQNYTFVIVQDTIVKNSFQVFPDNKGNFTQLTECDQDVELIYKFLPYDLSMTECYFVTYICNTTDDSLLLVRGYGHTASDQSKIDAIVTQYNLVAINKNQPIYSTWNGCNFSEYCNDLFM